MIKIIAYCKDTRRITAESSIQDESHVLQCVAALDTFVDAT